MKPNKIIEIQANNSEIRIRVKKYFKTYFSRYINEDVLFRRFITCMDFGRVLPRILIQSLKERPVQKSVLPGPAQAGPKLAFFKNANAEKC